MMEKIRKGFTNVLIFESKNKAYAQGVFTFLGGSD